MDGYVIGIVDDKSCHAVIAVSTPTKQAYNNMPSDVMVVMCPTCLLHERSLKLFTSNEKPDYDIVNQFQLTKLSDCREIKRGDQEETLH